MRMFEFAQFGTVGGCPGGGTGAPADRVEAHMILVDAKLPGLVQDLCENVEGRIDPGPKAVAVELGNQVLVESKTVVGDR